MTINKKTYYSIFILSIFFILGVYALPYVKLINNDSFKDSFLDYVDKLGIYGYLILILLNALQVIIAFLPGEAFEILSGISYGPYLGFLACEIGIALAATLIYYTLHPLKTKDSKIERIIKKRKIYNIINDSKRLKVVIFFVTIIPIIPKDIIVYTIPFTDIKLKDFLIINFFARIPSIISSTFFGFSLVKGNFHISITIFSIQLVVAILGICFNKKIAKILSRLNKKKIVRHTNHERNDRMTHIKCSAKNCGYNKECYCNKQNVKVEGLFSRSKLGTFCQSFRNPIDSSEFKEEMASEMCEDGELKTNIGCSANYCEFNKENYCQAREINVGSKNAKYRSETQCDSFKLR